MSELRREKCGRRIKVFAGNRRDEYSPFKEFFRRARTAYRTSRYGLADIDLPYLKMIWEQQKGICPYTQIKMTLAENPLKYRKIQSLKKASLDRIDSTKGYIKGNVEFVCSGINLAKNSFTCEEMREFITEIKNAERNLGVSQSGGATGN